MWFNLLYSEIKLNCVELQGITVEHHMPILTILRVFRIYNLIREAYSI